MLTLFELFLAAIGIQVFFFIPAFFFKTDKFTDFSYGFTFIALSAAAFWPGSANGVKLVLTGMVFIWAVRLIAYLVVRIRKIGKDERFDTIRNSFWQFWSFFFFQGASAWVIMLPSIFLLRSQNPSWSFVTVFGSMVWLFGFLIEAISDHQKFRFRNNPANKDKWIESGLWAYSRHPNYFGEVLCWTGIYMFSIGNLLEPEKTWGLVSPVLITVLLLLITGIPKLEESAEKKWGRNSAYQAYKRSTSIFFILPRKR